MKYYTIAFPGEFGQHVVETWSEHQIVKSYIKYWSMRMIEAGKGDEITVERCIDDWCAVHWAEETDEWGNKINPQDQCWCHSCQPIDYNKPNTVFMRLCPHCGNKRCPRASNHNNPCTNSNEPNQSGSIY